MRVAAAQFPVGGDLERNRRFVERQTRRASEVGARVVLFPETALSGYAPKHIDDLGRFDWSALAGSLKHVAEVAAATGTWVVVGSMRRTDAPRPRICVHVIDDSGVVVATYDKRRLTATESVWFSPGSEPVVVDIDGHRCGFLICYENVFPELYADYRGRGVGLLFHAFFNAANTRVTQIRDLMRANLIARAADHRMWIVASNSSERYSPMPAAIARPDGTLTTARRHVAEIVVDRYPSPLGWTYDDSAPTR